MSTRNRSDRLVRHLLAFGTGIAMLSAMEGSALAQRRRRGSHGGAGQAQPAAPAGDQGAAATPAAGAGDQQAGAQTGTSGSAPAATNIRPIPLNPGETVGNRVAEARTEIDNLNFDRAIGLLLPLHDMQGVPPAVAVEAALLETNALVAQQLNDQAIEACRRAVVMANYNPAVARDQSPPVQAVCNTAADQARRQIVSTRHIEAPRVDVVPGPVAFNPVRINVHFEGDLTGLTAQAEVAVADHPPVMLNLPSTGGPDRIATLDANSATPGARVAVTPVLSDAFGVVYRAEHPTEASVPQNAAAVQFAVGSDEGPLSIDGRSTHSRVAVGSTLPLEPGPHTLEVQTEGGLTSRAQVTLHPGEVALLTLHSEAGNTFRDVAKYGSTGLAVVLLGVGGAFQFLSYQSAQELQAYANQRDLATGLPLVRYTDVESVDRTRVQDQYLATGFFIGGGVFAVVAAVLWATGGSSTPERAPASPPPVSFGVSPNGVQMQLRF